MGNPKRRCLPVVLLIELDLNNFCVSETADANRLHGEISAQLPLGSFLAASYKPDSSEPEHPRYDPEKPFTGFNAERCDFRSVLAAMLVLLLATWIYLRGWFMAGCILAGYGIFGLVLRIELWSLAIRIM